MVDLGLWYQDAVINGQPMPTRRKGQDPSGLRWQNLIEPLVAHKGEGRRFVELGCNAGYYLRQARKLGYETIGVENDPLYLKQAQYWEEADPMGVKIIGANLNKYEIPVAHTVLLANIIYWLTPVQVTRLVGKLRKQALYVIVVGRHQPLKTHRSPCKANAIRLYFPTCKVVGVGDWGKHFSMKLRNPDLVEVDIDRIVSDYAGLDLKIRMWEPSLLELLRGLDQGKVAGESYCRYMRKRGGRGAKRIQDRLNRTINLYHSICQDGLLSPLYVRPIEGQKYQLNDGDHRLVMARHLGIKKVICTTAYRPHVPSKLSLRRKIERKT